MASRGDRGATSEDEAPSMLTVSPSAPTAASSNGHGGGGTKSGAGHTSAREALGLVSSSSTSAGGDRRDGEAVKDSLDGGKNTTGGLHGSAKVRVVVFLSSF